MAIKTVPSIQGPNFGGVIYGLNLNVGYSSAPSTLTINVVNKNGKYPDPVLNSKASISFDNFRFNGTIWSFNKKQSANESTLEITIVDNSIILDRYFVLLWKRNLLNLPGTTRNKTVRYDFSDETILAPIRRQTGDGFPFTSWQEISLGSISLPNIPYRELVNGRKLGNIILVGTEKIPGSKCDIPDTFYFFNDLKSALGSMPINLGGLPSNNILKMTHEGTVREVLANALADLGFEFYWDFSNDRLVFFAPKVGISQNLRNIEHPSIISKEYSRSLEGTYVQCGIGYTASPKRQIKELSNSITNTFTFSLNPIPISYYLGKLGQKQSFTSSNTRWGGNRNESDFLTAAFLGFVSRSLRDLYSFREEHWEALGYEVNSGQVADKSKLISFLKKSGYEDTMSNLESFDAEGLPNYRIELINRDESLAESWNTTEQKLLQYQGRFYRAPDTSGSFFYCSRNVIVEITSSVEPEGGPIEDQNVNFKGGRIFDRGGGRMSHELDKALEELNYTSIQNDVQNCAPIHIELKESGLYDNLVIAGLIDPDEPINTIVIFPNESFIKRKIGFTVSLSRSSNPYESSYDNVLEARDSNGRKNCKDYRDNLKTNSCTSYEEIARNEILGRRMNVDSKDDNATSGLFNNSARMCNIRLKSGSLRLIGPADGQYQAVGRYQVSVTLLSAKDTQEIIWSSGSPLTANNVAEFRVVYDNVTDIEEDRYGKKRLSPIPRPENIVSDIPNTILKYVFAGDPVGIPLNPSSGLSNLDVSLSENGYITTVTLSSKPFKPSKVDTLMRRISSQFNRASFNSF
jgi:hypothetical protein